MIKLTEKKISKSYNNMSSAKYEHADNEIGLAECIINTIREPLLVLDKDFRVIFAGSTFLKFFMLTTEETIGKQIYDLGNHSWDIPELRELLETILPERLTVNDYIIKLNIPEIGKYDLLLNATQIQRRTEQEKAVLLAFTNTAECKNNETDVKASEEEFRIITENSADAIFILNAEGRYTYVNDKAVRLLGYSKEEMLQLTIADVAPKNRVREYYDVFQKTLLEGSTFTELELIKKDGSVIPTDLNAVLLPNGFIYGSCRDLTERKKIQSALKSSEERFRTAARSLTDVIYEWDIKDKLDWYGDIDGITGYEQGEFPRTIEGWEAIIHPEDKDSTITALKNHIKGVAPYITEYRIKRSDGGWRWWSARGTALRNDQGEAYKMIGSITDITEQKDIQNKIKFNADLLSHVGQAVIATDLQGKVIYWNNAAEEIYGWSSVEAMGQNIAVLIPAEQSEEQANDIMKELSGGNSWSGEFLVKRKNGSMFPAYVTDAPIIDSNGKLTGIIGISNDITERKRAEESLRESHQIIEGIINSIPVRVFWKDRNLTYLGCNNLFAKDAGFTNPNEIIGKDDFRMGWKNQAELYRKDDLEVMEAGRSKLLLEEPQTTPEGKDITLLTSKIPLRNSVGEIIGVLGTYIDITERKQAEEEIKKSHEQLFKLNAEKDKFFSIIAHDLRTPFNGFLNLTELMADTTEKFSLEEFAEYSKMLNNAAQNIFMLLNNLLEWAQIQKGSIKFAPQNSDLSRMVSQSIDTIYQSALQKRIAIVNEINIPQKVYADEKSINTVLRNLLSNAIKFTRVDGKVIVKSRRFDDSTLQVSIQDNGVGISENEVKKLFRIEEKVSSLGTEGEPSTGLGLFLCKEFIEMHGGKIWAESEIEKGSTFSFTLREENGHETKQ